jgi:hypothetical protein
MTEPINIKIPYNFAPRDYQLPLWNTLEGQYTGEREKVGKDEYGNDKFVFLRDEKAIRKFLYVWHRRAGKDLMALNWMVREMFFNVGTYWHIFPNYAQGKKAIWQETTAETEQRKLLDYFPEALIKKKREDDMMIEFTNGSIYQIIGADNPDKLRGSGVKGVVISEFAYMSSKVMTTVLPMLNATKGWLLINSTPQGQNHFYDLYQRVKNQRNWFTQILDVEDTKAFTDEELKEMRSEWIAGGETNDKFDQEYYCSFTGSIEGAYYTEQIKKAKEEGRIGAYRYDESRGAVHTAWDLGGDKESNDSTAIWFFQVWGDKIICVDYEEGNGKTTGEWINIIASKGYNSFGSRNIAPWDADHNFLTLASNSGFNFDRPLPKWKVKAGIEAVRRAFLNCYFDEERCKLGLKCLSNYRQKYDDQKQVFKSVHDWSSHGADSFRYMAMGIDIYGKHKFNTSNSLKKVSNLPRETIFY